MRQQMASSACLPSLICWSHEAVPPTMNCGSSPLSRQTALMIMWTGSSSDLAAQQTKVLRAGAEFETTTGQLLHGRDRSACCHYASQPSGILCPPGVVIVVCMSTAGSLLVVLCLHAIPISNFRSPDSHLISPGIRLATTPDCRPLENQ